MIHCSRWGWDIIFVLERLWWMKLIVHRTLELTISIICPRTLPLTYIWLLLNLICLRSVISGLMDSGEDRVDLLARIALASMECWSLTKIGLGLVCCSLNWPSRKQSRICVGSMCALILLKICDVVSISFFLQPYISRRFGGFSSIP